MVKLSKNEIDNTIEQENADMDLPRDAHSVFCFEIEETSADLLKEMKELPKKYFPDIREVGENGDVHFRKGFSKASWEYAEIDEKHLELRDPEFNSEAQVEIKDDGLDIITAWGGYNYKITDKKDGKGAKVEFRGPVNALLKQNLLPSMTYVPSTLEGKFVDAETQEDLTGFMDMHCFGIMRAAKNEKKIEDSYEYYEKGNSQDNYGFWVNMKFNNEIDFLPKHVPGQEYKNEKAQSAFKNGEKKFISEYAKETIQKRIEAARGKVSGVVEADKQARKVISSKMPVNIRNQYQKE